MTKRIATLMSASALALSLLAAPPAAGGFELKIGSDEPNTLRQRDDVREARREGRQEVREARQDPDSTRRERRAEVRDAQRDMHKDVRDAKREHREDVRAAQARRWPHRDEAGGITIEIN
ncbi:MAG: hypothetical protein AcusKO_10270 [Acuticoccus sp.]